jgi:hypothetical protein
VGGLAVAAAKAAAAGLQRAHRGHEALAVRGHVGAQGVEGAQGPVEEPGPAAVALLVGGRQRAQLLVHKGQVSLARQARPGRAQEGEQLEQGLAAQGGGGRVEAMVCMDLYVCMVLVCMVLVCMVCMVCGLYAGCGLYVCMVCIVCGVALWAICLLSVGGSHLDASAMHGGAIYPRALSSSFVELLCRCVGIVGQHDHVM